MSSEFNIVNWFEIPVNDLDKATKFYSHVFKCELQLNEMGGSKMAWFPMHMGAAGATGTLIKVESYVPSHSGTMVYLSVDDIESTLKRVEERDGKVLNPKTSIGEFGFVVHFQDSEANRVGLHSQS